MNNQLLKCPSLLSQQIIAGSTRATKKRSSLEVPNQLRSQSNDHNKICQWYCCSCGQSYGSIMYKRSETNSPRTVSENNEHADTEEKTGELNDQLMQNLKYYSLLVYDHNEDAKEFSYTTNCLEENNERIESISPKRPHSVMVDTPRKKIIESKKARQVSLLGIENNHDTLENGFDIITNEAKLFPLRTKSSSSENTDIEIHDLEEILRTRKQKSVFHTEITPEPETVLLKVPTRFTCHRCNHMMCPYCPKVRVKDLTP